MLKHLVLCIMVISLVVVTSNAAHPVHFDVRLLAVDLNEGCDIADIDGDGKLDIVAGRNWYRNDEWVSRPVRIIEDNNSYARTNGEWAFILIGKKRMPPAPCWCTMSMVMD